MSGAQDATVVGGRYVLIERLAAGPDSTVWRAHDDVVNRPVVVKLFTAPRGTDPAWRAEFGPTADRLVALSHPGLAKVHEHGETADSCWLAMACADGDTLADRLATDPPMTASEVLDLIGQAALALGASHASGVAHGAVEPSNLLVAGGVVRVVGYSFASTATAEADVRALGELARDALDRSTPDADGGGTNALSSDIADFLSWTAGTDRARPVAEATEVGRTALALSGGLAGRHTTSVVPGQTGPDGEAKKPQQPVETPYEEMQRKRVRNRLIALGAIVVIGGAILLRFVGQGGGDVTVPDVVGLPLDQAQITLTSAGLRDTQSVVAGGTDSGGTVAAESPAAGTRVKAGTTVTLTLAAGSP